MSRQFLLIGPSAACNVQQQFFAQKGCNELIAAMMDPSGLTAADVEQKVVKKKINRLVFIGTPPEKTAFITGHLKKKMNGNCPPIYWVSNETSIIDYVEKIVSVEEII